MSPARVGFNAPSSKNSRLIFAQQPRPNDKRNPLLHVLRTSGTGRAFEGGALLSIVRGRGGKGRHRRGGNGAEQGRWGRSAALSTPAQGRWMGREGAEGGGFGERGQRSEVGGQGKPRAGTASALGERSYSSAAGRRRSLVKTGTAEQPHGRTRTNTDGHGRLERAGCGELCARRA